MFTFKCHYLAIRDKKKTVTRAGRVREQKQKRKKKRRFKISSTRDKTYLPVGALECVPPMRRFNLNLDKRATGGTILVCCTSAAGLVYILYHTVHCTPMSG